MNLSILIFLSVLVGTCRCDWDYAGSTFYGMSWNPPSLDVDVCTPNTTNFSTKFQNFNVYLGQPTFLQILVMFNMNMTSSGRLWIFDTPNGAFNSTAASNCDAFVAGFSPSGSVPPINNGYLLSQGNYTFVISDSSGKSGQFSVNIRVANYTGNNYNASRTIRTPRVVDLSDTLTTSCATTQSIVQQYDSYTWVQLQSGFFDVSTFFFNNGTSTIYPMIFLYLGTFPSVSTPSTPPDACSDGNLLFAWASTFPDFASFNSINLQAGSTYTFVVTPGSTSRQGDLGIFIDTTIWGNTTTQPQNYSSPDIPASGVINTCIRDVNLKYWQAFVFTAQYSGYIIDAGDLSMSEFDTAAILYNGNNTSDPPSDCTGFISAADTADGALIAIFLTPGEMYTVVITAFQPGATQTGIFPLYMITGEPLGVPAQTTSDASSTMSTSYFMTGIVTDGSTTGENGNTGSYITAPFFLCVISIAFSITFAI